MEETGIYDIEDEASMNIVYEAISSESVEFHILEKDKLSVKVIYDCGEDKLEGNLNMEQVACAQHMEMYSMMIGLLDISLPPPTIISTEVQEEERKEEKEEENKDNFYYNYYQIQMVSIYDV
jgi:hypothetical protein